jgi:hypothetical protein
MSPIASFNSRNPVSADCPVPTKSSIRRTARTASFATLATLLHVDTVTSPQPKPWCVFISKGGRPMADAIFGTTLAAMNLATSGFWANAVTRRQTVPRLDS